MEENKFDYNNYIQMRLREIDDLDERRFAKELLVDQLEKIFTWTEEKYDALAKRIENELDMPWKSFHIFMTVTDRKDYDPIHPFWFPVCSEDLHTGPGQVYETIYLAADEEKCREFLEQGTLTGTDSVTGEKISFRIEKSGRYRECIRKMYRLFANNHIPWQTVHMGYLERFYDLIPLEDPVPEGRTAGEGDVQSGSDGTTGFGKWDAFIKRGIIPLWNVERTQMHSREFRMPCMDEIFYEHIFYLPEEREEEDGYLIDTAEDILSIRYEKSRVLLKAEKKDLKEVSVYRLHQGKPEDVPGYHYPVLSNCRKDSLSARFLQQTGNFIQTPMELYRKIGEMSGGHAIHVSGYGITDKAEGKILCGDMDGFLGGRVFADDKRSILLIRIRREEGQEADYMYEAQVRYILTQLQAEFMEYRCVGVFE